MTERAYYDFNSSLPFMAEIVAQRPIEGSSAELPSAPGHRAILLDKTIFYPGGGGQPSDRGSINGVPLLAIEEAIADIIEENHPVIIHLCPPEDLLSFPLRKPPPQNENEVIRVIEIEGQDIIACSGTHVKSTAEIGMLRIYSAEKYKGKTRISFSAGRRLLRDSRLLRQNALIVSHSLSVPINETGQGILDFLEKSALSEKRLKELEDRAISLKAAELLRKLGEVALNNKIEDKPKPLVLVESYSEEGINEVISIGKGATRDDAVKEGAILILASEGDLKFAAFSSVKGFDLRSFLKEPFEKFGAQGGGGPSFFQGNFRTKEDMAEFLRGFAKKR